MGYASIENLYVNQTILLQPECFALEKIHGSSAHLHYIPAGGDPEPESRGTRLASGEAILKIFSGEQQANVEALFDKERLLTLFGLLNADVRIYGECYGGKVQQNYWRYGKDLRFTAFDVKLNGEWLTIPEAEKLVKFMELEFVHYVRIETKLSLIDAERDAISEQAIRNGVTTRDGEFVRREGVVLRPIEEKPDPPWKSHLRQAQAGRGARNQDYSPGKRRQDCAKQGRSRRCRGVGHRKSDSKCPVTPRRGTGGPYEYEESPFLCAQGRVH